MNICTIETLDVSIIYNNFRYCIESALVLIKICAKGAPEIIVSLITIFADNCMQYNADQSSLIHYII